MKEKVLIGMSGGVDSSAAAYLLKQSGYEVEGVTMLFYCPAGKEASLYREASDALSVCKILGIPHHTLDLRQAFDKKVISPFCESYLEGRTPNPCILCNREMKFAKLLKLADELGAEKIATGHYAGITRLENGRYTVKRALHDERDQTYALCRLTQEQLSRTLMPLYGYDKVSVRQIASMLELPVAEKKDSQDICFIPDGGHLAFLKERYPDPSSIPALSPGNYVDKTGKVLGVHEGLARYTIGQRKGLRLAMGHPVFVTALRQASNEVVIGENEDLMTDTLLADSINFMGLAPDELSPGKTVEASARIRYAHKGAPCLVSLTPSGLLKIDFTEKVRAVTPGQSVVVCRDDVILLSGTIIA